MVNKLFVIVSVSLFLFSCAPILKEKNSEHIWWKESVFYEIYMPSYADSNGDGYGDFIGMTDKLGYLQELGVKGIWLTPFLRSPKVDNGYDVASYYDIDPTYGTSDDFIQYINEAHKKGIKVIMDLVLNHSSTDCEWFQESRKSIDNPYRDYYIWTDKPNNWESFFGGGAWQLDTLSQQYYYHKFDVRMADLNWANPKVVAEMQNVLRHWLDLGVDGFRLDVINFLTTDGMTHDNPIKDGKQEHLYDINQAGVKEAMRKIKSVVNEYENRFIVGEIGSDQIDVLKHYQSPDLMDVVFNFNFGSLANFSGQQIFDELQRMEENMSGYPTLFFGSHDMPRVIDRLANGKANRAAALACLMLTAKGVPFIYYGEEIGMHNISADSFEEIVDIQGKTQFQLAVDAGKTAEEALIEGNKHNRDKSRSPMQWNGHAFSGFSTSGAWIKINTDFGEINVAKQLNEENSLLMIYKKLIAIRNDEPALQYGNYSRLKYSNDHIVFTRTFEGDAITVVINFGTDNTIELPAGAKIVMSTNGLTSDNFVIYKEQS